MDGAARISVTAVCSALLEKAEQRDAKVRPMEIRSVYHVTLNDVALFVCCSQLIEQVARVNGRQNTTIGVSKRHFYYLVCILLLQFYDI